MSKPFYTGGQCKTKYIIEVDHSYTWSIWGTIYGPATATNVHGGATGLDGPIEDVYVDRLFTWVIHDGGKGHNLHAGRGEGWRETTELLGVRIRRVDNQTDICRGVPAEPIQPTPQACAVGMSLN